MSHARAHHRRAERAARRAVTGLPTTPGKMLPEGHYGVLPAWCFHRSDLPDARRMTHDALIESMGTDRSGGVSWVDAYGPEAHRLLAELDKGAGEAMATYLAEGGWWPSGPPGRGGTRRAAPGLEAGTTASHALCGKRHDPHLATLRGRPPRLPPCGHPGDNPVDTT